jgi:N-acetylneuraminic acid mutarotase
MESELSEDKGVEKQDPAVKGSVAHHIINKFVEALAEKEDYKEVASKLKDIVFEAKLTEADLRKAMFGEDPL